MLTRNYNELSTSGNTYSYLPLQEVYSIDSKQITANVEKCKEEKDKVRKKVRCSGCFLLG